MSECIEITRDDKFFYIKVNGKPVSSLNYKVDGNTMHIISIFTMPSYRGRGFASRLMNEAIRYAKEINVQRLVVYCSFAKKWLEKHSEHTQFFKEVEYRSDIKNE
mgnify:CR=1 FL=1